MGSIYSSNKYAIKIDAIFPSLSFVYRSSLRIVIWVELPVSSLFLLLWHPEADLASYSFWPPILVIRSVLSLNTVTSLSWKQYIPKETKKKKKINSPMILPIWRPWHPEFILSLFIQVGGVTTVSLLYTERIELTRMRLVQ